MHGPEPAAAMSAAAAPPARLRLSAQIHGWLLLLPAAVLLVTFTHYPAVATIIDSFFSTPKGRRAAVFVGADNYQAMLGDPVFWRALGNNIVYAASVIPLTIALSLSMAIWVNGKIAGRPFLRLSFFTPTVLPMIAVANIWLFFYAPGYGLLDQMLGVFGIPAHNWLGDQSTALVCLIAVAVWKDAGFFMIFYLAALQQMSPQLAEAAAIEGAGRWYFFRRITFPLLMPTTLVRPDQRHHQFVPADRPYRGHDPGRAGQHHGAAAVLHLRSRLQVLGHRLCGDPHGGAARFAGDSGARPVPHPRPPDSLSMSVQQTTSRGHAALETAGAWLLALIWILPLAYALWAAIHPSAYSAHFVLDAPLTLENFARAWNAAPFARYFLNTFLLVTMILAAQFVLCTLAAYAFARFAFAGRDIAFILVLLQLMIMPDVLIVENYRTMSALGIVDTIPAIGLPYMASAFGIFLLRQTFKSVPRELDEAARVEGAGPLTVLLKVYVPLAKPVYIAYGLVSVSYHWNNFLWPLIVTNSVNTRPLTVGLQIFASTDQGIDWSVITAATLMTSAPLLVAFLLFQRQFVQSFMRAGIR